MADRVLTLGCHCAGCCTIVRFERFAPSKFDPSDETWVEFYQSVREHPTLRYRLSTAWKVLRGRRDWNECLVLAPEALAELRLWLEDQRV